MRTAALFAAAAAILPSCLALPSEDAILFKRQGGSVSVTGIPDGRVGVRREITELSRDEDAFNLYLLAIARYVNSDPSDILSYHQISGIHGLPCQPYGDVQGNPDAQAQGGCGYCTHSTNLFPPWHRAYIALYEQGFYQQVQGVISDFQGNPEQQAKFLAAASGLRVAFWDWAAGSGGVPSILTQQSVTVPSPNGGSQTIPNPLYSYKYQVFTEATTGGAPWSSWPNTLRYPTSNAGDATSNVGQLTNELNSQFRNVQALTYKMLLNCKQYSEFADDSAASSSPDCASSLESIHGLIHVLIGGSGHMSYLDQAGFDPTFWLHHTNVDRLASIWQVAQDRTWYTGGSNGYPTYTHTGDQYAGGDFPLTPFYKDAGSKTFWTPNELADWTRLGYTYPEFSNGLNTGKSSIISDINRLYGSQAVTPPPPASSSSRTYSSTPAPSSSRPPSSSSAIPGGPFPPPGNHSAPVYPTQSASVPDLPDLGDHLPTGLPIPSGTYDLPSLPSYFPDLPSYLPDLLTPLGRKWDWAANIVAERSGLGGSYGVYLFLGEVPKDSSQWGTAKNLIGVYSVFASKHVTSHKGRLVSGSVSLIATLVEQIIGGNLKGLDGIVVEPFLAKKLSWAVKKVTGEVVPNDQVPGLQVKIVSSRVKPAPKPDAAPEFEVSKPHDSVTNGEAGGSKGDNPYGGSTPYTPGKGNYGSGSNAGSGGLAQPSCIPNIKYVYEYVTV